MRIYEIAYVFCRSSSSCVRWDFPSYCNSISSVSLVTISLGFNAFQAIMRILPTNVITFYPSVFAFPPGLLSATPLFIFYIFYGILLLLLTSSDLSLKPNITSRLPPLKTLSPSTTFYQHVSAVSLPPLLLFQKVLNIHPRHHKRGRDVTIYSSDICSGMIDSGYGNSSTPLSIQRQKVIGRFP